MNTFAGTMLSVAAVWGIAGGAIGEPNKGPQREPTQSASRAAAPIEPDKPSGDAVRAESDGLDEDSNAYVEAAMPSDWTDGDQDDTGADEPPPTLFSSIPPFTPVGHQTAPAHGSLWRSQNNVVRLVFEGPLPGVPQRGEIMIQELWGFGCGGAGPQFGADLSERFTFTVEDGNVLRIGENGTVLTHRKWYAIRNVGGWPGVSPFEVHYPVTVGDANGDNRTLFTDLGNINARVPLDHAADQERRDIDGDGRVLFLDMSAANARIPSDLILKPCGH